MRLLFAGVFLAVLTVMSSMSAVALAGNKSGKVVVLTSIDAIQAMAEVLTEGTSIEVRDVIPEGYPMRGQDSYLKKHHEGFLKIAASADAVVAVGSVWPGDPLYKWARRGNIKVVQIDAAKPLDGYGAGVPLLEIQGRISPLVWRSPANMTRMASIVAKDFALLVPEYAEVIRKNLNKFQSVMFMLRSKYEAAFVDLESVDLVALTDSYSCLADEFGLDIHFHFLLPEDQWTDADVRELSVRLKNGRIKGVVCAWEPDEKARRAIREGGSVPVVLRRFIRQPDSDPSKALRAWYDDNLFVLLKALQR